MSRRRGGKFSSYFEGMQRATHSWACASCFQWYPDKTATGACEKCGGKLKHLSSAIEMERFGELKLMQIKGLIEGLTIKPRYDLKVEGQKIGIYEADFAYKNRGLFPVGDEIARGALVVEDVKPVARHDPLSKHKIRHFQAQYCTGLEVAFRYARR